ncbi:hypothetical protein [Micromonospora sp. DT229]|uniref:hypothetical protein n=1 Tax=Micromonospora sp. DT229 TaxID=3393430 RepID=UPI003CF5D351
MPDLFTRSELEAYPPPVSVPEETAALVLSLVTAEIRAVVGADRYDRLTDLSPLKAVALALARRMVDHPGGRRSTSRSVDDYTETDTWAVESLAPAELTAGEVERIRRAVGLPTGGAFTIRPGAPVRPAACGPAWRRC